MKKSKFWPWALAWLILAILSCYIRLYPLRVHMWDNSREQAILMSAVAYTPLFSYLLISIAFLWVCRVLNYSVIASFIGALFLIMAPINLKHGSLGWFRTDPCNILFSFIAIRMPLFSLKACLKKRRLLVGDHFRFNIICLRIIWARLGIIIFVGAACSLGTAAYNFFIKKDRIHTRQNLLFLSIFIGTTLLAVSICFSFRNLYPNPFMAVGELKRTSLGSITTSVGGPVFMLLALGGWMYSLRMALQGFRQARAIDTLILTIFLIVTMTLSLNGEKFVLFTTIPLSILAAAAASRFISLRSVGLPLAGLLIALILFNADRDIRTVLTPADSAATSPRNS